MQFLKDMELEGWTDVSKLCALWLTTPATSSSVKRKFLSLKRIKKLWEIPWGVRDFAKIAFIYWKETPRFYDDVINEFTKGKPYKFKIKALSFNQHGFVDDRSTISNILVYEEFLSRALEER